MLKGWRIWTIALAILTMALSVVVVVQALMLRSRGWTVDLGNVAEWVAAAGTLGALGAVVYAAMQWGTDQRDRREREADQARLIIVQPFTADPQVVRRRVFAESAQGGVDDRDLVVSNRSGAAVFNLLVDSGDNGEGHKLVWEDFGTNAPHSPYIVPVLGPGGKTAPLTVVGGTEGVPDNEFISFTFTDSHSRRWRRTGSSQPVRIHDSPASVTD